jgi:hypothetical protein
MKKDKIVVELINNIRESYGDFLHAVAGTNDDKDAVVKLKETLDRYLNVVFNKDLTNES